MSDTKAKIMHRIRGAEMHPGMVQLGLDASYVESCQDWADWVEQSGQELGGSASKIRESQRKYAECIESTRELARLFGTHFERAKQLAGAL